MGQAILVCGIGVGDVSLGLLEFGLAKFDDGAETEVVAGLREVEGQARLFAKLLCDGEALIGAGGVLPGSTDVARDVVAKAGEFLAIYFGLKIGGLGARVEKKTIENGDIDIQADGAIPITDVVVANGSYADDAEGVDGGTPKVMLGAAELLRGLDFVLKRENFGALLQCLLNKRENIGRGGGDGSLLL